eukprot:TRINITY_DN11887_c0_g1_i2.p1 TRINITY_DN11887_c0_g1~~TRINITY_DN11887_c0_g1_i2.p1  ORF type:complete len:160 (+),score=31.11 TRINITY_DN11887_c0_g1_i2:146-625(+)
MPMLQDILRLWQDVDDWFLNIHETSTLGTIGTDRSERCSWKVEDDRLPIAQQFAACVEDGEQETCLEEATPDMNTLYEVEHEEHVEEAADTSSICVGDDVEAYWPDDDVWIMASVEELKADGSCVIIWAEDGSRSEVPADYVRRIDVDDEPSTKRLRLA